MIELQHINPENLHDVWNDVRPFIERAIDEDTTVEYVLGRIIDHDYQLWVGGEMDYVAVTRIEYFEGSDKYACLVMYLAGENMEQWKDDALAQIESWAAAKGMDELRIVGRPGWERVFRKDGFRKTHTILAKPIGGMQ